MTPYNRFINKNYIRLFNRYLKSVCEPLFYEKYKKKVELKLYGIVIRRKNSIYDGIPKEELLDSQAQVMFFIDTEPNIIRTNFFEELIMDRGKSILQLKNGNEFGYDPEKFYLKVKFNSRPLFPLDYVADDTLTEEIEPSDRAKKNICDSEKFCKAQGKITFGQLKALVESAKTKKILTDVGEGGYKATLRLLPWFFPQLAIAGFTGSVIRAFNKVFRPALEDTTGYKTWWGKTIMKIFNMVEGELGITDPLSKIFFISDGLLTMLDNKEKIKFARYIAEEASKKPDDEEVPEFYVENELRHWLNEKFLLDPPLPEKKVKSDDDLPFDEIKENGIKKRLFKENVDNEELKWHFDELDRNVKIIKSNGWQLQMDNEIPKYLKEGDTIFIPKGKYHRVIKGKGNLVVEIKEIKNEILVERNKSQLNNVVRTIVKDIVKIFKENDEGDFYLPEDLDDNQMTYEFSELATYFSFEVTIEENKNLDDFKVNGEYAEDDDTITIVIHYNPDKKRTLVYDLIGELNEIVAHEIRHIVQREKGHFNVPNKEKNDPYKYYTQPHELDALNFGFKRMARMTKKPIETLVKNWFDKNEDIHMLNSEEKKDVIKKILNYKK